jgi:hypothetical protein
VTTEVKEIFDRFRNCDRFGFEEMIALLPFLSGQPLDTASFALGLSLGGRGGAGLDSIATLVALTSANTNSQVSGMVPGAPTNSLSTLLPLLMILGQRDWEPRVDRSYEVVEKSEGRPKVTATR